ncbi:MAG: hypothetical protein WBP88_06890 [Nitrososphaeraceae archaeon]
MEDRDHIEIVKTYPVSVDNLETTILRWDRVGFAREQIAPVREGFIVSERGTIVLIW